MESPTSDPNGSVPVSKAVTPSQLVAAVHRRDYRKYSKVLKRIGGYLVPASAVLYALGFALSVSYYHRRGVPLHALGHPEFIGAGLLFAALWVFGYIWGNYLGTRVWWKALIEYALSLGTISAVLTQAIGGQLRATVGIVGFMTLAALPEWISTARAMRLASRGSRTAAKAPAFGDGPQVRLANLAQMWAVWIVAFGWLVFPLVPKWLGGGAPQQVEVLWTTAATVDEQPFLGNPADRRCVFETFSDTQYVYLSTTPEPKNGNCSARRGWRALIPTQDDDQEFVAVPRSRIRLMRYQGDGGR